MNTFLVVTFAWSLAFSFFVLGRLFRCPHDWQLVDKTEFKPPIEDFRNGTTYQPSHDLKWMHTRTVVLVIRCTKCGKAKVIRESNT